MSDDVKEDSKFFDEYNLPEVVGDSDFYMLRFSTNENGEVVVSFIVEGSAAGFTELYGFKENQSMILCLNKFKIGDRTTIGLIQRGEDAERS